MSLPVLFAIDEDERSLREVERELVDRYSRSYRVVCASSAEEAMAELEALAAAGEDVDQHARRLRRLGTSVRAR